MYLFCSKILLIVVCGLAVFFSGSSAYLHDNEDSDYDIRRELLRAFTPLKWDGVCPKKSSMCPESYKGTPPVLVVSLDGFRPDYLARGFTPTLQNLINCGVKAEAMYSVFPTKTFPNHYTQVTGLYPVFHGIVDNTMYDNEKKKRFKLGTSESFKPYWWKGEPLWVTAIKQNKKAACFFWPGSDVLINNIRPTYFRKYKSKTPFETRVNQILEWLELPAESRPNFLTLYFNQPDHSAHRFGIQSKEVNDSLVRVDKVIEKLYSGLQERNLIGCVNVIILSDHGMVNTSCKNVINLQDHDIDAHTVVGVFGRLRPKDKKVKIDDVISKLKCQSPHARVYAKENLPVRYHYAYSNRVEPIFVDLDAGWTFVNFNISEDERICSGAAHGYDNLFPDMQAMFMANGPSFKENTTIRPFVNVELYELLTELMNISANPNNGTRGSLHHMLKSPQLLSSQSEPNPPAIATVPVEEMQYNFRIFVTNCSCGKEERQKDIEDISGKRSLHLPFGVPHSHEDNDTLRLLYNEDYISAFDAKYRMPMWTSFTLNQTHKISEVNVTCWRGDPRITINDAAKCSDYKSDKMTRQNILQRPLYPPSFSSSRMQEHAMIITNAIPKSLNHSLVLEDEMNSILAKWTAEGQVNVISGPAFNLLADGIRPSIGEIMKLHEKFGPMVVPTHIFVITTWCSVSSTSLKNCHPSRLETAAFLLPNEPYVNNCEVPANLIAKNTARVVDVEKLTGLSVFTGLPIYDAIRLGTQLPARSPGNIFQ